MAADKLKFIERGTYRVEVDSKLISLENFTVIMSLYRLDGTLEKQLAAAQGVVDTTAFTIDFSGVDPKVQYVLECVASPGGSTPIPILRCMAEIEDYFLIT